MNGASRLLWGDYPRTPEPYEDEFMDESGRGPFAIHEPEPDELAERAMDAALAVALSGTPAGVA
jgi:hypothetical protein